MSNKKLYIIFISVILLMFIFFRSPLYNPRPLSNVFTWLASCENNIQLYQLARINCIVATKIDPTSAWAFNTYGDALRIQMVRPNKYSKDVQFEFYKRALILYEKALQAEPSYNIAHSNRGDCFLAIGLYEPAIIEYQSCLKNDSKSVNAWYRLGFIYSLGRYKQYKKAVECFEKAIELNPKHISALINLSYIYDTQFADYPKALEYANRALKINPNSFPALGCKGYALIKMGKYKEAKACADKGLKINPNWPRGYAELAMIYLAQGNKSRAKLNLQKAIKYEKQGDYDDKNRLLIIYNKLLEQCK